MRHSILIALAFAACSQPDTLGSTVDLVEGQPDISWADDEDPQVQPPDIDWLEEGRPPIAPPDFGDCREGWIPVDQDGVQVCEPWPEGRKLCTGGEAQFPGEAACAPVDGACPTGDFAADLVGEVRYVRPGSTDGDGSLIAPFATIQQAADALPTEGGTIALSRGDHIGAVVLDRPVELVGACAAQTRIVGPECGPGGDATVSATADLAVRSLQITGSTCPGLRAQADLSARGVVIHDVASPGLQTQREAALERVAVRDVGPGQLNAGIAVGPNLTATDLTIERTTGIGLSVGAVALLELNDVAIVDVAGDEEGSQIGLFAQGSAGSYSGLVVEDIGFNAVYVFSPRRFEDVVIRGGNVPLTRGLSIRGAASTTLNRVWIQAEDTALRSQGAPIEIDDALIQGTGEGYGLGVSIEESTPVQLERVVVQGFGTAVQVQDDLLALDVVLHGETPLRGFSADGSTIGIYRGELLGGTWEGLISTSANADVTLSNVWGRAGSAGLTYSTFTIEHSLFEINGSPFFGLSPTNLTVSDTIFRQLGDEYTVLLDVGSGELTAERVAFEGGDSFAIEWSNGIATLTDITLSDRAGGISVTGGELELTRARVTDIRGVGVAVGYEGIATIRDLILVDTARGDVPERPAVALYSSGRVFAERVLAQGTDGLSVVVDGGQATLNDIMAPDGIVVQRRGSIVGERVQGEVQVDPEDLVPAAWGF